MNSAFTEFPRYPVDIENPRMSGEITRVSSSRIVRRGNPSAFAMLQINCRELGHYRVVYGTDSFGLRRMVKKSSSALTRNNVAEERPYPPTDYTRDATGTGGVIAGLASKKLPSRNPRWMDARSFRVERKWRSVTAAGARRLDGKARERADALGDPCDP